MHFKFLMIFLFYKLDILWWPGLMLIFPIIIMILDVCIPVLTFFYLNLLFSVPVSLDLLDGRSRQKCRSHMNFFTPSFRVVWRINTIPKKEWEFILHLPWSFVYIYYDQHFGKLNLVHNGGNNEINGRVSLRV